MFSGLAAGIIGVSLPLAYPKTDPSIAKGALLVAATLLLVAAALWVTEQLKMMRATPEPAVQKGGGDNSFTVNQTNSGGGSNWAAHTVVLGPRLLQMTEQEMEEVAARLDKSRPVHLAWADYGRTVALKNKLHQFLEGRGFQVRTAARFGPNYSPRLTIPIRISLNGIEVSPGATMFPGMQVVSIDGDILIE